MLFTCIVIAVKAAVLGYTYAEILIQPGEILHWLYRFFQRLLTRKEIVPGAEVPEELQDFGIEVKEREIIHEHWLLKPLGACAKCVSGQIALWLFLTEAIIHSYYSDYNCIFTVANHLFTICLAIIITRLIQKLM